MSEHTMREALLTAAKNADWLQVRANGGPPCFHLEGDRFCLRSERWEGHGPLHRYTTLFDALASSQALPDVEPVVPVNDDLATLVRRLSYSLRKASPEHTLPDQAMDYLRRHNLDGSPLRAAAPQAPAADALEVALRDAHLSRQKDPTVVAWFERGWNAAMAAPPEAQEQTHGSDAKS